MFDLISTLAYFHSLGDLYKHIDPTNIFLWNSTIYLAGLNFYADDVELTPSPYHAPEVQSNNTPVTRRADIYSLGRVFVDIIFCACGIERTVNEFQKYESKQVHNNFMNTGNLASNHHSR